MTAALEQLRRDEAAYQRAAERAERRRRIRDESLRRALATHSQTQVAAVMGVTRGRVGQLATRLRA